MRIGIALCRIKWGRLSKVMFDQRVVLLNFFLLVKLRRGVLNYITKCRRNGLSPSDQSYHVHEETESCVTQPSPNLAIENPSHSQPKMMRSTRPSNSICFFWVNCMSEGKKVKLAFHAVVANYCGNLVMSSIIFDATTYLVIGSMST
jgi:hypothetical protein